jgi:hypothetical protein
VTTQAPTQKTTDRRPPAASRRRRRWIAITVLVTTAVLAAVLVWFQPQVLLYDTVVEDDFPTATPAAEGDVAADVTSGDGNGQEAAQEGTAGDDAATDEPAGDGDATEDAADPAADPPPSVDEPVALLTGTFDSRNHYTVTGGATAYELPDGTRILRLEGFESTNGPDLFVYLTVGDASEPSDAALAAEHVDLGVLRGNVGSQNYVIPADVDLARFNSVVIWCRRFGTAFGAADLG